MLVGKIFLNRKTGDLVASYYFLLLLICIASMTIGDAFPPFFPFFLGFFPLLPTSSRAQISLCLTLKSEISLSLGRGRSGYEITSYC